MKIDKMTGRCRGIESRFNFYDLFYAYLRNNRDYGNLYPIQFKNA